MCEVRKFQNTDVFRTDLKQIFDCIRYSEDKKKLYEVITSDPAYRELDEDAYDVIAEYTDTEQLMEVKQCKEKGKVDMCKAIEEMIQDGRMEGLSQGLSQGISQGLSQGLERGIQALILDNLEEGVSEQRIIEKLQKRFDVNEEQAREYYAKYGK